MMSRLLVDIPHIELPAEMVRLAGTPPSEPNQFMTAVPPKDGRSEH